MTLLAVVPMARNKNSWFSFLKRRNTADNRKLRDQRQQVRPVEQLERRLCLGSMHAGLAEWGRHANLNEAAEIRLDGDPADWGSDIQQPKLERLKHAVGELSPHDSEFNLRQDELARQSDADQDLIRATERQTKILNTNASALGLSLDQNIVSTPKSYSVQSGIVSFNEDLPTKLNHLGKQASASGAPLEAASAKQVPDSIRPAADQVNFRHQKSAPVQWDSSLLASIGLETDRDGNAIGYTGSETAQQSGFDAWWLSADEPVVVKYDFRSIAGHENQITQQQQHIAVQALQAWSQATDRQIVFERDTQAAENRIINIGVGDLAAAGHVSGEGAVLGVGGGQVSRDGDQLVVNGLAWLDHSENWDNIIGNGNPEGTFDFATVVSHEIGHTLGYGDQYAMAGNAMDGNYSGERSLDSIQTAVDEGYFNRTIDPQMNSAIVLQPMVGGSPQLTEAEVEQLLRRGAAASASEDAIIAVVDRNGRILGVRVERDALAAIPDMDTLVFAIDGAVAKARTAALFSNGDPENGTLAPLTSRTVRFLSQSTITQREVESNPNVDNGSLAEALASTTRGPGFVAPIGVGGHFPPEINFTPLVDLFGIEHTNRDSTLHPGPDGIKGTADDISFSERFNIDPEFVDPGQHLTAPESYGAEQNSGLLVDAQSRGIATLPGGIPLFRDTDGVDGGDTLIGGIGVFFPGPDGYATHEQGFIPAIGQTETQRTNAARVLEAEFIAYAAAGGSAGAQQAGISGAKVEALGGVAPVAHLDLPFGRLDLVGIQLEVFGPMGSRLGAEMLVEFGQSLSSGDPDSGADQVVDGVSGDLYRAGESVPEGWLVRPHDSADGSITAADVERIISNGVIAANNVRAAVRLPISNPTRMVFAVTDTHGEVLGLFRMKDSTTFSIDVAVAKARNVAYFADASDALPIDQVGEPGVAYTNRTFRFLAQPRFPSGINGTEPAPFSILHDGDINQLTAENNAAPDPVSAFIDTTPDATPSVYGRDSFFPNTNFNDPGDGVNPGGSPDPYHTGHDTIANQNGIVFFPGSTPIYKDGQLIGGFGVSGDGVDQDDVVTYVGATGFLPESHGVTRADQTFVRNIRLPFQKFLRNPFGGLC